MTELSQKHALVTGGAGFIGSNLAYQLLEDGHSVTVMDTLTRPGTERNLSWLRESFPERLRYLAVDVRNADAVRNAVEHADVVFHFAAQVAVTTSFDNPRDDFEINLGGTLNILEAARMSRTPVIFASTNKVYGDLHDIRLELDQDGWWPASQAERAGVSEQRRLEFHTPYGCSKGAADQYVLDYARNFGVPSCVLRMSCIYGQRQMGTEDQGWVAHFLITALRDQVITLYGDGRQVRDILYVGDAVSAYIAAWRNIEQVKGRAFNLGGGAANGVSLRQLLAYIETLIGRRIRTVQQDWRPGDQRFFVADTRHARSALDLRPATPWREGVAKLADWLRSEGLVVSGTQAA